MMFKSLMTKLLSEEKWDDVVRAAEDVGYRKKLYREYGIN